MGKVSIVLNDPFDDISEKQEGFNYAKVTFGKMFLSCTSVCGEWRSIRLTTPTFSSKTFATANLVSNWIHYQIGFYPVSQQENHGICQ
uniref:Cytochrome P450 n=1 Tax=Heterorhabditis bacteriophora TaxID=37862 RepID=A0A1I7X836_HETBA